MLVVPQKQLELYEQAPTISIAFGLTERNHIYNNTPR